jgi:hypothetical protein
MSKHTYLARVEVNVLIINEVPPLHIGVADPWYFPKCAKLEGVIIVSGICVRANPLKLYI